MKTAWLGLLALAATVPAQTPASQPGAPDQTKAQAAVVSDKVTYVNDELGLAFEHPKDWKTSKAVIHNPKPKFVITDPKTWRPPSKEHTTKFLMPLPGVSERGVVEIYSAQFFSEPDIWQTSQRDINEQIGGRTILRQWQEELLGVPLLMTKIQSDDKGQKLITETGMMYSATARKLVFRLSSSPDNFDKADYEWRQALQTLRTTDGVLPNAEDPNRPKTNADLNPEASKKIIWTAPVPAAPPLAKGSVVNDAAAGGKKLHLLTPAGWKVVKNADGSFTMSSPEIAGTAKVVVASDLDSDTPDKALFRATGMSLDKFSKVKKRQEKGPFTSRSQMSVAWVYRTGSDASKPLYSYDAIGFNSDFYWTLAWIGGDSASAAKDRKALDALVDIMSVEVVP